MRIKVTRGAERGIMGYLKWKCPEPAPDRDLSGFRFLFLSLSLSLSLSFFFLFALFYLARLHLGDARTLRLSFLIAVIGKQRGTYLTITCDLQEKDREGIDTRRRGIGLSTRLRLPVLS